MIQKISSSWQNSYGRIRPTNSNQPNDNKFGTFAGVFTPTVLTILGAIMYLRLGQVVGNAGLGGALLIIFLAHVITVSTGLSVSSISTNTRVGAGGAFAIISKSLGLEVGGSVGIPLFMAQGISVALYVLAFAEAWQRIFPNHPYAIICVVAYFFIFLIAYRSAQFAARIQFIILAIVVLSLISIALGALPIGDNPGFTQTPEMWGSFALWDFWQTFAIFFPAVTGIMAGISMSGALRSPRKSIPKGTMIAIFLTMIIYLVLAYWLSRIATPEEMMANQTIMVDKALWGWAVLMGMLGATFSSALGSLVAAPRVMQALAVHKLVPFSAAFAHETPQGEPRPATIMTGVIGLIALLAALSVGGAGGALDAIAEVITMFFLIAYGSLNLVILIEQTLGMVSFRPTFKVPRLVPLTGLVGCLFVMFLVNPAFSLVAMVLVLTLFILLTRRKLNVTQNDVRSGLFISLAEWATKRAKHMPSAPERAWKPVVLAPVRHTAEMNGSFRFCGRSPNRRGRYIRWVSMHQEEGRSWIGWMF
ncbi:MAG: amino acid permease [Anaerolineae bacterium]|nr:amino acid permease [Anaerolineae bacterium]